MKVYLAGPDVFLPDAVEFGRRKAEICARHGLIGLYPLDNAIDLAARDASLTHLRGNKAMMIEANAIIANLTPFRGPGADAGTVYELGYMAGRGKLCLGYSNDPALRRPRRANSPRANARRTPDRRDGLTIEDFGLSDNLMIIRALDLHGCALVTPRQAPADTWHDLAAFEACVRMAAERLCSRRRGHRVDLDQARRQASPAASARTCCWSSAACSKAGRGREPRSRPASSPPTTDRCRNRPKALRPTP